MKHHDVIQNTPEWDDLRLGVATGSNASKFMANYGKSFGEPAIRYALKLALEQINNVKAEYSFSNAHMERGHEQEPEAIQLYEEKYFLDVKNGGFFDCGRYGDSPDGLVNHDGVIEVKSVIAETHYKTFKRDSFDPSYKWQYMSHLDCSGREWVDAISYCSDFPPHLQLLVHRLYRSEFTSELEMLRHRRELFLIEVDQLLNNFKE